MQPTDKSGERRIRVDDYSRLLDQVASGRLERIQCPACDQMSVSVYLTRHQEHESCAWFMCASCDFRTRAANARRSAPSRPAPAKTRLNS